MNEPALRLSVTLDAAALHVAVELRATGPDAWFVACLQGNPAGPQRWLARPWLARDRNEPRCVVLAWTRSPALTGVFSHPAGAARPLPIDQPVVLEHREPTPLGAWLPTVSPGGSQIEVDRVRVVVELEQRSSGLWARWTSKLTELEPGVVITQGLTSQLRTLEAELPRGIPLTLGEPAWGLGVEQNRLRGDRL